jgi:hypothetical protein
VRSRLGLSFCGARTTLLFNDGTRLGLEQLAISLGYERRLSSRLTLGVAAGALVGGRLVGVEGGQAALGPGAVTSVSLAFTALEQLGARPFVMLSGAASFGFSRSTEGPYTALDVRVGVTAGYTLFDRLSPYLVARAFGGPVFWRGQMGTDAFHYQLGLGAVLGLPAGFDLSVEFVPLGEQRLTGGVGISF